MLLRALRLTNFRNLPSVTLTPNERFNIFTGANGQGKTNILEAIYLLSAVKSFRGQSNADLIKFGETEAKLEAHVDRGGSERIVRIEIGQRGKKVFLNNQPVRALSDFFGTLNVVMFGPEDITLLKGSPSERRRFIDRAIFNARPAYGTEMASYEDVLKNRNTLLKTPQPDPALLDVYAEQLIQYGADILVRRLEFLRDFQPVLESTFQSIFDESFTAHLGYHVRWLDHPPSDVLDAWADRVTIESELARALEATRHDERDRGHTLVGPHRDDLVATLNGHDVKAFASQGQHRAFVLAMKIAEITHLEDRYHFAPILLLDDVSSELDQARNRFLFDFLDSRDEGQVFITTTHRDYILLEEHVDVFSVDSGIVTPQSGDGVVDSTEFEPVDNPVEKSGVPFPDPPGFSAEEE